MDKLKRQRCGYCQGYGHSANDCPTDAKLTVLRMGTLASKRVLVEARKECRKEANMEMERGLSLLRPLANHVPKKRSMG